MTNMTHASSITGRRRCSLLSSICIWTAAVLTPFLQTVKSSSWNTSPPFPPSRTVVLWGLDGLRGTGRVLRVGWGLAVHWVLLRGWSSKVACDRRPSCFPSYVWDWGRLGYARGTIVTVERGVFCLFGLRTGDLLRGGWTLECFWGHMLNILIIW